MAGCVLSLVNLAGFQVLEVPVGVRVLVLVVVHFEEFLGVLAVLPLAGDETVPDAVEDTLLSPLQKGRRSPALFTVVFVRSGN